MDTLDKGLGFLLQRVAAHMLLHYRMRLDDLEISDTPGYWRDKEPRMHPGHPLHGCLFNREAFQATYTYFDEPHVNGRFASRTRTWKRLHEAWVEMSEHDGHS